MVFEVIKRMFGVGEKEVETSRGVVVAEESCYDVEEAEVKELKKSDPYLEEVQFRLGMIDFSDCSEKVQSLIDSLLAEYVLNGRAGVRSQLVYIEAHLDDEEKKDGVRSIRFLINNDTDFL